MRKLKVDLGELAYAMEDVSWENHYYLDLETGKVVIVRDEMRWELESIYEEACDPETEEAVDLAQVLEERGLPEWYQQALGDEDLRERLWQAIQGRGAFRKNAGRESRPH